MQLTLSDCVIEDYAIEDYVIEYDHLEGEGPCVIFCAGFKSNRQGNKALAIEGLCHDIGLEYVRFDYAGHGDSDVDFANATISTWLGDVLNVVDHIAKSKEVILVGSSMGGWLALLAALARPARAKGLVLLACAADMTRYYPERFTGLNQRKDEQGRYYYDVPNGFDDGQPYYVYQAMIDDGAHHFLLDESIKIAAPVRLIHGMQDDVVEWQRSQQVLEKLQSNDATLTLVKNGDHRLSGADDLALIKQAITSLLS